MHKATKLVKAEVGGECRFLSELEEGRFLVSSAPEVSDSGSDDILAVGGIQYYLVEKDFIRLADERESQMGNQPSLMRRLRELEKMSGRTIYELLEKYSFQGTCSTMPSMKPFAEGDTYLEQKFQEYEDWVNDGKPTGIQSDREFYALQKTYFGEVIYFIE